MLSLGAIGATASAQSLRVEKSAKDIFPAKDNHAVFADNKPGSDRARKEAIDRINREYDFKIMSIKRNRYMREREKNRQVQMLERERSQKIREAYERFDRDWHYNERDNRRF